MYYLVISNSAMHGDDLHVLDSTLMPWFLQRILTHATSRSWKVIGWFADLTYMQADPAIEKPIDRLDMFVDPKTFNEDKIGTYWSLFSSREEALSLVLEWRKAPRYTESEESTEPNYFRNQVDNFDHLVETRWSQQLKSTGASTSSIQGPSTAGGTGTSFQRARRTKT